jgi:hypothetical protein
MNTWAQSGIAGGLAGARRHQRSIESRSTFASNTKIQTAPLNGLCNSVEANCLNSDPCGLREGSDAQTVFVTAHHFFLTP